jgi:hypothetical protein
MVFNWSTHQYRVTLYPENSKNKSPKLGSPLLPLPLRQSPTVWTARNIDTITIADLTTAITIRRHGATGAPRVKRPGLSSWTLHQTRGCFPIIKIWWMI